MISQQDKANHQVTKITKGHQVNLVLSWYNFAPWVSRAEFPAGHLGGEAYILAIQTDCP
jgi:hypothetical protein